MKKRIIAALLAWILLLAVSGCGAQGGDSTEGIDNIDSTGENVFVLGDPTFCAEHGQADLNPHHDSGGWACIRYGVGETLFRLNDQMELEPWLGESYENLDELTWRITLREGVAFTSGRTLDGEGVKECLEDLTEHHIQAAEDLQIAEIQAEGMELIIRTENPVPDLICHLAEPYGCIYDVQAGVTEDGIVQGTGPYMAVSVTADQGAELVKNENYWDGEPNLDRIRVRTIRDGDTLTMALQSGEIDAAYGLPYASYPLFENDNYTFSGCATSRVFFGAMNFQSPTVSDPAVRQAVAMGIDKEGFVEVLLGGRGSVAAGVYPDSFSFGGDAVTTEGYDPEGAKAVLEAAGWTDTDGDGIREKDGRSLILRWLTYPGRQELPLLAESAQAALGEIGIQVEINSTSDYTSIRTDSSAWDIYVSSMVTAPTGDPEYFFASQCLDRSPANYGGYHSDELERLALALSQTFDTEERADLAVEMQQIILDDHAFVFCSHLYMSIVSRAEVTGLSAHPCDYYEITADLDMEES